MGQGVQKGLEVLFGHVQSDHRFFGAFACLCSSRAASLFLLFALLCLLRLWMTPVVMWANGSQPCASMGVAVMFITQMGMGVFDRIVVVGMGVPDWLVSPSCVPLFRSMAMLMVRVLAV